MVEKKKKKEECQQDIKNRMNEDDDRWLVAAL